MVDIKKIEDCPHGMGLPAACIDCMADGPVKISTGSDLSDNRLGRGGRYMTTAKYRSNCTTCGGKIEIEDLIGFDEEQYTVCDECVMEEYR